MVYSNFYKYNACEKSNTCLKLYNELPDQVKGLGTAAFRKKVRNMLLERMKYTIK